jgi:MHS family proline/betaine transporter-like MFS transporter
MIGNFVEWYDLAIYAYTAAAIGKIFFVGLDPGLQVIVSFAVFALTYLVRPVAGAVLGVVGDRFGRKNLLIFTILIMGFATTAIGLLPGHSQWGAAATFLLLFFRVLQGVGAAGEFMGAATFVVEHSPKLRRGLAMGLIQLGTGLCYPAAFGAALALIHFGGQDWFNEGGWRILFLISAPLTLVALYIRRHLDETPVFREMKSRNLLSKSPLREVVMSHGNRMIAAFLFMLVFGVNGAQLLFYFPNRVGELAGESGRWIALSCMVIYAVSIPAWGYLLDRMSRHSARMIYCIGGLVLPIPCHMLILGGNLYALTSAYVLLGILVGLAFAIVYVTLVEIIPASVRFTGTALVDNTLKALIVGPAVLVSLILVRETGSNIAPAYYATALGVLSFVGALWISRIQKDELHQGVDKLAVAKA